MWQHRGSRSAPAEREPVSGRSPRRLPRLRRSSRLVWQMAWLSDGFGLVVDLEVGGDG
jgi:hypothetical protein